ncbi:MAG: addiction module toxin, HicA family [Oscillatoriales cyanobacterium]|nr:MAG: addiction module toxin, HicA family [Oscillatoriales cyanobacterium]TAF68748.1 MAG: addiction module toxin, HicA family [Oscillatoriales cyanobacterium]
MAAKDCLSEQILYQSKSSYKWTKEISLATLSNHPYDLLQSPPPLQVEREYLQPRDSKPIPTGRVNSGEIIGRVYYVRGVPPTFIEDYTDWIKEPFKVTGSRTLYTSTVALFFVSGLIAWIIIEVILYAKRNEQHLAQQQRKQLQREIQQIKLQLEEKNQQTIELIDQRERGLAELESYRQEEEQNKRELENQIGFYESELALKEQQQRETAQTLEDDLQLLRQKLQETSQRESEAKQQIKLQLEEKNQQNIELADQRERVVAELESARQEQEQNKRELENQIASYESELALKEQQQQETAQTLEDDLQLLRQELQETSQRESEAKQQSESLNQKIANLKRDRDLIQQQSRQLKQQLETIPNINELTAALEGARTELDRTKEQSRDGENYYVEEIDRLEKEKVQLNTELCSYKKGKTHFLEKRNRQLESALSAAQEKTQTLENTIEYLNVQLQNPSQNSHSAIPWSQLPRISGRQAIGSLERLGFRKDRQNGSHVVLERVREQIDSCTVPFHDELDSGTLAGNLRQANVTLEDFLDNLRSC